MKFRHGLCVKLSILVTLVGATWLCATAWASPSGEQIKFLRGKAEQFEREAEWEKAFNAYEAILRLDRNLPDVKERSLHCLRRFYQVRRHRDPTYRQVLALEYIPALRLYEFVLDRLMLYSLDKSKVEVGVLFHKGIEELRYALADSHFCNEHLRGMPPEDTYEFRKYLQKHWGSPVTMNSRDVREQVREVALKAMYDLKLNLTITVFEFICGACYAFDDYTTYLTPGQFKDLYDSLTGEYIGIGIKVRMQDGKLVIVEVAPEGPAATDAAPPLQPGDQILRIDGKSTATMKPETAMHMLEGKPGSIVELVIASPSLGERTVTLKRRSFSVPSLLIPKPEIPGVGYLKISCFQETTLNELNSALATLQKGGMKVLILDLRGNEGGLVGVAIDVARRFLTNGLIAKREPPDSKGNYLYEANNPGALTLPMVVLVDGDTASAAELLAGALKDNNRARLVGQTTYGKGCSQTLVELPPPLSLQVPPQDGGMPTGGLRITIARYFSPLGYSYSGRGVVPHIPVTRSQDPLDQYDSQFSIALIEAQRFLDMMKR